MFNVDVVLAGCPLAHQDHDGLAVVLAGAGQDLGLYWRDGRARGCFGVRLAGLSTFKLSFNPPYIRQLVFDYTKQPGNPRHC